MLKIKISLPKCIRLYGGQNISRENFLLIQVFAFEFGDFANEFVPFAIEFVAFAIEFRLQLNSSVLQLNSSRLQLNSGFCS